MNLAELNIKYPIGFELVVHLTKEEIEPQICLMAALKMFELGKISSGKAAELAGLSRPEFFEMCGRYHVSIFNYPPDEVERELRQDLETIRRLSRV